MKQEQRYKIARLPQDQIVRLFNSRLNVPRYLRIEHGEEIPEDAVVVAVWPNFEYLSIDFTLYHESFEVVPLGCMVPSLTGIGQIGIAENPMFDRVRKCIQEIERICPSPHEMLEMFEATISEDQ